jgi:hypothetical protein
MAEKELTKIANYLNHPIKGKLSYTEDNIIQMQQGNSQIIGFSTIVNFFHNEVQKEQSKQSVEDFYLTKQFFDFANVFIRSTSKRDKCKKFGIIYNIPFLPWCNFFRCGMPRTQCLFGDSVLSHQPMHFARRFSCILCIE